MMIVILEPLLVIYNTDEDTVCITQADNCCDEGEVNINIPFIQLESILLSVKKIKDKSNG